MTRVTPHNDPSEIYNHTSASFHSTEINNNDQVDSPKIKSRKDRLCCGIFSMKVSITLIICLLVLCTSVFTWLSSYVGSLSAFDTLSMDVIDKVGEKVKVFLNGEISPCAALAKIMAADYNNGLIGNLPPLSYYFNKNNVYYPSAIGLFFPDEVTTYFNLTIFPNGIPTQTFSFYQKPKGYIGVEQYLANETDGSIIHLIQNQTTPFVITSLAYWVTSFKYFDLYKTDAVYGDPYIVVNSTACIYYSVKLYNRTLLAQGTKKTIGISKVNVSLLNIEKYLKKVTVLGRGYVLVAETNDFVIGGSINTTAADRVKMSDLTERDSGTLMKGLAKKFGKLSNTPSSFEYTSLGVDYIIKRMDFDLENMKWNLFMVIYKEDVNKVTNMNTAISAGVAVSIILIGLVISALVSYIITHPLTYLKKQFALIKKFDLEKVQFNYSAFKEVNSIYKDLHVMVSWLNDFKSFLPESIFLQLSNMEEEKAKAKQETSHELKKHDKHPTDPNNKHHIYSSHSIEQTGTENTSSNSVRSLIAGKLGKNGLFKLGLQTKYVSVITILINPEGLGSNGDSISKVFSKIASGLSALSKTLKADLQINSVYEYQLSFVDSYSKKKPNLVAVECSIKVAKVLDNVLSLDTELDQSQGKSLFSIGVSSGKAHVGNLGNNSLRYYTIVGPCCNHAKLLATIGSIYRCKILADGNTVTDDAKPFFVCRPIDRLLLASNKTCDASKDISTIYEIFKENNYENDEWLYELEQQKKNLKYKDFERAFQIFDMVRENKIEQTEVMERLYESMNILKGHLLTNPEDCLVTNHLIQVFEYFTKEGNSSYGTYQMISNYHTTVNQNMRSYSASGVSIDNAGDFEICSVTI